MPRRKIPDKLKLIKGTYRPCRAGKTCPDGLAPLPEPPRRVPAEIAKVWREISRKAPHLRAPDQFFVEIAASLLHQFRTEPCMQTARTSLLIKLLNDLGMTPLGRKNIPLEPMPNEFDEF